MKRDIEKRDVQEVSLDVKVVEDGPTEVWPGDKPLPKMENDQDWDDFVTRYDLSEVFGNEKLLTTSQHGYVIETRLKEPSMRELFRKKS